MERGLEFEQRVGQLFARLAALFPEHVEVSSQLPVELASGRRVIIDFRLAVDFPHEKQSYYFELQSRQKHGHELSDKIEAIRRDTRLTTFSFVHESQLEASVAKELEARNVPCYDWEGLVRFTDGLELQLMQWCRTEEAGQNSNPESASRLAELVKRMAKTQEKKKRREARSTGPGAEERKLIEEIKNEIARDPDGAIRQARKLLGF